MSAALTAGRLCARIALWACAAFLGALLAAAALPGLVGFHSFTVMSGSMEPEIHVGDIVVDRRISPLEARVGDIVTFRDPSGRDRLITHRLHGLHASGGTVQMVTKGDANDTLERWSVPVNGHIGRVSYRVWKLGYPLVYAHSRYGLMGLVAIPALVLCLLELRRIWRAPGPGEAREAAVS